MFKEKPPQTGIEEKSSTVVRGSKLPFRQKIIETLVPVTDRTFDEYLSHLGFKKDDLAGKIILDVGSGKKERFSKEAEKYGAKVYSVNPKLKNWMTRKKLQGWFSLDSEWQKRSIATRAQRLSFKDNQFDAITSLYAFPLWFTEKDRKGVLKEMIRVLKPGGKIYLSPRYDDMETMLGLSIIEWIRENGCSISPEQTGGAVIIIKNDG